MKKYKSGIMCVLLPALVTFTGCRSEDFPETSDSRHPVEFDVEFATRTGETVKEGPLYDYFIDGRSVILLSQRTNTMSITFDQYIPDPANPGQLIENPNLYKYVYYTNPSANWESGFNFRPYNNYDLDWDLIEKNGPLNSEYSLGALYYPVDYEINNMVQEDQSSYENLLRSNVMGAWHRTNAIRSRLRFKFYHLMAAFRITLLIPDWDPQDNSGFGDNSVQEGRMLNVKKDYTIDWPLNLSSEEPPNPQTLPDSEPVDLRMYLEPMSNAVETVNLSTINPEYPDQEERIRRATFLVIFPAQQPTNDGPAMRFYLRTMGGTERKYIWYSSQLTTSSNLDITRNSITNLILYLPRTENNAILIKSYIAPWQDAESEFNVFPDDE